MDIPDQSISVIVLAAASQASPRAIGFHSKDAGFLNVGTKLAIDRIASFFSDKQNMQIYLAVVDADKPIYSLNPFSNVLPFSVGHTDSACDTLDIILQAVTTDWCLINPITAVPTSHLSSEGAIYFGHEQIPRENWSGMTMVGREQPIFHSKEDPESYGLHSFPFTGRIYSRTESIRCAVEDLGDSDRFDLLSVAAVLFQRGQATIRHEKWLDAGHLATYADSKLLSISSRFFNRLNYDKMTNTISKRSRNKQKLELEGRFLDQASPSLSRYFPALISSTLSGDEWKLEMEYIGYPTLSEIFLYGQIGLNGWRRIINSLIQAFDAFYAGPALHVEEVSWLYSIKTIERQNLLEELLDQEPSHPLNAIYLSPFRVNDISYPCLKDAFRLTIDRLMPFERERSLYIGHGDLCFNNILVDPLFGTLKFIDPKAAIHKETGICGLMDPLYDLAKLNHSFCGLYDSVVNDLYSLQHSLESGYTFRVFAPKDFRIILRMFQDMLLLERVDEAICTLATANLFLSMLPLHRDDPERMVALSIIGTTLLIHENLKPLSLVS